MTFLLNALRRSRYDARLVPPARLTHRLTLVAALAMSFLAVFALVVTMAADRQANQWQSVLANTATLRLTAPTTDADLQAALEILATTDGVAQARPLSQEEHAALLTPWLGADVPLQDLPVPTLVEVTLAPKGLDTLGLTLRLQAELPGAIFDDHSRWRAPLIKAATRLRGLGWAALALILTATATMVALSAQAAMASNKQEINVLHLVGAVDRKIARAFIARYTGRAFVGAVIGSALGLASIAALPNDPQAGSFLTALPPSGLGWAVPLLVPFLVTAVAYLATRVTVMRLLKETTL